MNLWPKKIKVLIGGDVCPIGLNLPYFKRGDIQRIFNDLVFEFDNADLSIVNLECPLVDEESPIFKIGPVIRAESACINGLKEAKIDVVNLANNHIMDHGAKGLNNTLSVCASAGIAIVGAGKNIKEARRMLIRQIGRIKIGILGVAEHEFSIATHNRCGANPLDLADYVRNLRDKRNNFDYLIVLLHGGNEYYPLPNPRLKDTCHFLVEMGANAVIVQHTHCAGSYEEYQSSHIVYGQGNLIFDLPNRDRVFYEGFLVKLSISEDLTSTMSIIPYTQSLLHPGARGMKKKEEQIFLNNIKARSSAIKDDNFVRAQWLQFCDKNKYAYLNRVFGHNFILKKLIARGLFLKFLLQRKSLMRLQNTISCEAHREVLETILDNHMI